MKSQQVFLKAQDSVATDGEHGLVFGFAMVSKVGGQEYYDTQGDHIPEDAMIKASVDFMENGRIAKEMHQGDAEGTVPFAIPITSELRKFIAETDMTGLLIGMRPSNEMMAKFKSGEFTGFSIGGKVLDSADG